MQTLQHIKADSLIFNLNKNTLWIGIYLPMCRAPGSVGIFSTIPILCASVVLAPCAVSSAKLELLLCSMLLLYPLHGGFGQQDAFMYFCCSLPVVTTLRRQHTSRWERRHGSSRTVPGRPLLVYTGPHTSTNWLVHKTCGRSDRLNEFWGRNRQNDFPSRLVTSKVGSTIRGLVFVVSIDKSWYL